jgi:hypothetical protein
MKTTSKDEFMLFFIEISQKLTLAELRMLYLLITEPEVIELSQQEFADRIKTHRRTINIGLKKLKKYNFIYDITIDELRQNNDNNQTNTNDIDISNQDYKIGKDLIIETFVHYYRPYKKQNIIVNEDFFFAFIGELRLHETIRYNREFIIKVVKQSFPKCKFYYKQPKSSYPSVQEYNIIHYLNYELNRAMTFRRYYINKESLLRYLSERHSISEVEVVKVIRNEFPLIKIGKNDLKMTKPWKGYVSNRT